MIVALFNLGSLLIVGVRNSVRPIHLFDRNRDHDYFFELPSSESGIPNHYVGDLLHTMAMSGLSRVSSRGLWPAKFHENNSESKAEWERLRSGEIDFAVRS